jgi:Domain of unknown function (DUF3331)
MSSKLVDPWLETIQLLEMLGSMQPEQARYSKRTCAQHDCVPPPRIIEQHASENAHVWVAERLTPVTAAIEWSDATRCNYSGQIWRAGIAARPGSCALSGESIRRGQAIYRPIPLKPAPSNAKAMILASRIEEALRAIPANSGEVRT